MTHLQQTFPINIIHADDDIDDRVFFRQALSEIQIDTRLKSFRDGELLMNYLTTSKELPHILFLDLSMPRKTGFECLAEIKENENLKNIPVVVFTTSFGRNAAFEQSLMNTLTSIGALEYIRKPNNFADLKKVIYDSLAKLINAHFLESQK